MTETNRTFQIATNLILFLSLTAASTLALIAPQLIDTPAGGWILGILGAVFVTTLLVLTAVASFADNIEGNTFSELLRASTIDTTFYPWALSVYMGRWFHPFEQLQSPLGIWGVIVLMITTWIMVVLGDILRRQGKRIWPWLVVTLGYTIGVLTWPA